MQRGAGCRGCPSTADPHDASTPQVCASTMPKVRPPQSARGPASGHGSTSSKCPFFRETGGHFPELRTRRQGSCSLFHKHTHTHTRKDLFKTEHFGRKCWSWMAKPVPGGRCWPGSPPSSTAYQLRGLENWKNELGWTGRGTKWQCTDRRTFPLAAAVTAWGRKRGDDAHDPQKCTQLGKKRCFRDSLR